MYRAQKRLYLTADRQRAVEEGDPAASYLLVAEGGEIPDAEADRLGLTGKTKPAGRATGEVPSTEADPVETEAKAVEPKAPSAPLGASSAETETKAVESAPENKARAGRSRDDG